MRIRHSRRMLCGTPSDRTFLKRYQLSRRQIFSGGMAGFATGILASSPVGAAAGAVAHVSEFGARGDARTNDTDALAAAARFIEKRGGGTLVFDRAIYLIGKQTFSSGRDAWPGRPEAVIQIANCRGTITLVGNGATLRCAPGLRFGTFDPRIGRPTKNKLPFMDHEEIATPYLAAIRLQNNHGGIELSGFELDGRINDAVIGGPWGDTGWQIPHHGLWLRGNRGVQSIRDIYSHHQGADGMMISVQIPDEDAPAVPVVVEDARCEYNGRQGISLIGGRGVTLKRCQLNHTGKNGTIQSAPGAGLDIEAEHSLIRDVTIVDCEFIDNRGAGFVADSGDSAGIALNRCRFVGTSNWAVWPNKPRIRFTQCEVTGALARCFEDPSGSDRATQFIACRFSDDPARSPSGEVYGEKIDLGGSGNGTLFDRCDFDYRHGMQLPWTRSVRFRDCNMTQRSEKPSYPRGRYMGTTRITAPPGAVHFGKVPPPPARIIYNGVTLKEG